MQYIDLTDIYKEKITQNICIFLQIKLITVQNIFFQ